MYKLNEEKMFYDYADGQAVVINYKTGMYYGMGLLASAVLDRIIAGKNIDEAMHPAYFHANGNLASFNVSIVSMSASGP